MDLKLAKKMSYTSHWRQSEGREACVCRERTQIFLDPRRPSPWSWPARAGPPPHRTTRTGCCWEIGLDKRAEFYDVFYDNKHLCNWLLLSLSVPSHILMSVTRASFVFASYYDLSQNSHFIRVFKSVFPSNRSANEQGLFTGRTFFLFKTRHTKTTYKKKVQNICRNSKEVTLGSYGEKEGTFPFISFWPLTELPVWAEAVVLWEEALARPRVVLEALAAEGQRTYDR